MRALCAAILCMGLGVGLAPAMPAHAQDAPGAVPGEPAFTPEDDLTCALFLATSLEMLPADASAEDRSGILGGLTYFIGRWEAVRGGDMTQAMVDHFPTYAEQEFDEISAMCGTRLTGLGLRMQLAGAALIALDEEPAAAQEGGDQPEPADAQSQ